jgi:hypothetical protein
MKGYTDEKLNMDRLRALDRALMASRLVQPEFYPQTEMAILGDGKGPNKELFFNVCEKAHITDKELVQHMWEIVNASKRVYLGHSPAILW